jgi:hypothetical protein
MTMSAVASTDATDVFTGTFDVTAAFPPGIGESDGSYEAGVTGDVTAAVSAIDN